jgi:hypothetical protein
VAAELHLAEETFALHLLLQRLKGLVDIVVADENLHVVSLSIKRLIAKLLAPWAYADRTQPQTSVDR